MGDSAQYSTGTREPIGLPSISTFTPMLNSNNGLRDQHSPRFAPSHTTHTTHTTGSGPIDSKPFSASISFAPLGSKQPQPPTPKREAPPHPPGPPAAIFHSDPMQLTKKKSPLKKMSPIPKNGPPPAKKLALTPMSPPRNGSNGGGSSSGMPALEAALRSPVDADARRLAPNGGPGPGPGPSPMLPPGTSMGQQQQQQQQAPRGMHHPAVTTSASRSMEFSLEGLSPFNPNEECSLMHGPPPSNGNNGYGYTPSPSNGHRGYFGETPRDSPLTLAPLEPLTTSFSTHSPAPHNGGNPYYADWSNPSLASPMTLPPLNTIFSGHSSIDQSHSSTQFSASPISAYSDPSPSASLLSISQPPQHGSQQAAAHAAAAAAAAAAARPHSRPSADYGHYSTGPLSHQSSSSIVWEEPPPPATPTTAAAGGVGGGQGKGVPAVCWASSPSMQQQSAAAGMPRRPSVRVTPQKLVLPGGKSPRPQDPAYEKVQLILAQSKAAENAAAARKAAEQRGEIPPPAARVVGMGGGGGKAAREAEKPKSIDDPSEQELFERREKKRLAQNEARRKKRAEKMEKDRIMAETGQLLLPVRQVSSMQLAQHQQHLPPPRHVQQMLQQPLQQPPMRKMSDPGEMNCSITASINAVVHLDSGVPPFERSRAASGGSKAAAPAAAAGCGGEGSSFAELRAAMLAEEMPLVIRKESTSMGPSDHAPMVRNLHEAVTNPTIVRHLQHPPAARPAHSFPPVQQAQPTTVQRKMASGVKKAREGLMREYQRSLGSSISPATSSRFLEVVTATRAVEEAQQQAERELERMQMRCAQLAEQTKLQHGTLQMHLRKITKGEDTTGLAVRSVKQQGTVMREGFSLRTLSLLDEEIRCRLSGTDPSDSRRRVSVAAVLMPPMAPAAALRLAPPPPAPVPIPAHQIKTEIKAETSSASTMTEREEEKERSAPPPPPSRRMLHDQSTRPLERCYLPVVKELLADGYAVREGGIVVRPRESSVTRSGAAAAAAAVHLVDTEGRVWSEAISQSHRAQNGVQQTQRRLHDDGEGVVMDERSSGRVLRSAHRNSSGYH